MSLFCFQSFVILNLSQKNSSSKALFGAMKHETIIKNSFLKNENIASSLKYKFAIYDVNFKPVISTLSKEPSSFKFVTLEEGGYLFYKSFFIKDKTPYYIVVEKELDNKKSLFLTAIMLLVILVAVLFIVYFLYLSSVKPYKEFQKYMNNFFNDAMHELKTPLAVMKTKNEVTLLKPRESEKYIEALKSNNEAINGMNAMIGSVLEIGRQEGAQFEEPVNTDVIAFSKKLGKNYEVLAKGEEKNLALDLKPEIFNLNIQTSLLTHIVQNFVQNAIKFSPKNSTITISSRLEKSKFIIEVADEGVGIDESKDLFAPFKRYGNKGGAGLGLFLAKGAAQALGAEISIKNRENANGAVASLVLNLKG